MNVLGRKPLAVGTPKSMLLTLRHAVTGLVILVSFYYVARKLSEEASAVSWSTLSANYYLVLASVALAFLCMVIGAWEWGVLLGSSGESLPFRKLLKVHMLSNPPKYIPGPGWQLLGKAYLCRQAGVSMPATALSLIAELTMAALSASALALLLTPYVVLPQGNPVHNLVSQIPLPAIGFLCVLMIPLVFQKALGSPLAQRLTRTRLSLTYVRTLSLFVIEMCTWTLSGVGFYLLVASLWPVTIAQLPSLVFASTVSVLVGLVAFSAPAGLGVREGLMTFLLSLWLPGPYPAIVAISSRMVLIVAELLGFVVATRL